MKINIFFIVCGWSFNSGADFFFGGGGSYNTQRNGKKAGQVATLCKCTCKTGSWYLPTFALWKPLSERLSAVCVASHDGGESSAACVHQFLFPSGENWRWNVRNAASSFPRVLLKSIENIWVVFLFQKCTPILWRRPLPRQAIHLPHRGDRGTCARNHSHSPTSDCQRHSRGCWKSIQYMPENSNWRYANETSEIFATSPDGGAEGQSCVNLHWPLWASPKWSEPHVSGNHWWWKLGLGVWPGNKANVLPVENCIISSTEDKHGRWSPMSGPRWLRSSTLTGSFIMSTSIEDGR